MDRCWLLTWTTYGTWLPGDRRGSTSRLRAELWMARRANNVPGTALDPPMPALEKASRARMVDEPALLTRAQANVVSAQLRETASIRGWTLFAVAIMRNHVHVVVGVDGDPDPSGTLRDFKSWSSRALNAHWPRASRRWWGSRGSSRRLDGDPPVIAAREYVRRQAYPLVLWVPDWDSVFERE
jgi:REP element-mobilizing transposase RayT